MGCILLLAGVVLILTTTGNAQVVGAILLGIGLLWQPPRPRQGR